MPEPGSGPRPVGPPRRPAAGASGSSGSSAGSSNPGSGGSAFSPSGDSLAQPADNNVSSSGDGVTISTRESAFLAGDLEFTGSVSPAAAGQTVEIERSGHQTHWAWAPTAQATIGSNGSFTAYWHANHIGRFAFRAVLSSGPSANAADSSSSSSNGSSWPTVIVTVYRSSVATQYGPGFYGQRTACGQVLRRGTIGLANRTLPCGTQVAIYYQGETLVVPVIDRGPYAQGVDWDLTEATGHELGIDGTARIGAVSLPRQP